MKGKALFLFCTSNVWCLVWPQLYGTYRSPVGDTAMDPFSLWCPRQWKSRCSSQGRIHEKTSRQVNHAEGNKNCNQGKAACWNSTQNTPRKTHIPCYLGKNRWQFSASEPATTAWTIAFSTNYASARQLYALASPQIRQLNICYIPCMPISAQNVGKRLPPLRPNFALR